LIGALVGLLTAPFVVPHLHLRPPPARVEHAAGRKLAAGWAFVDPALEQPLAAARPMSPVYEALAQALARPPSAGDERLRALVRLNLDRARILPPDLGLPYILVNPAAQKLWLYQGGRVRLEMPVVVGKPSEPTPNLAGLIRFAVLRPYWNIPPDLVRDTVAPHVLREGEAYLARQHYEVLSDWSAAAVVLPPQAVEWTAVAAGRRMLRVRQLPGPNNMMGQLKLMLPNPLGVYLHDTPNKALFGQDRRTESAGCVRLADAQALAEALFGHALTADPAAGPEQRVDLASPVPVYIVYLTAMARPGGGVTLFPDIYRRDQRIQPFAPPTSSTTPKIAR
jgi:murein L,D-transpeptidase YcbB/YkuD